MKKFLFSLISRLGYLAEFTVKSSIITMTVMMSLVFFAFSPAKFCNGEELDSGKSKHVRSKKTSKKKKGDGRDGLNPSTKLGDICYIFLGTFLPTITALMRIKDINGHLLLVFLGNFSLSVFSLFLQKKYGCKIVLRYMLTAILSLFFGLEKGIRPVETAKRAFVSFGWPFLFWVLENEGIEIINDFWESQVK